MTTIREFQNLMKKLYLYKDEKRGTHATLLWMTSEMGELFDAVLKGNRSQMEDEAADVLAWLCSACNLLNIDLENVSFSKYGKGCPKCGKEPCNC